jgi:hypothetical protein
MSIPCSLQGTIQQHPPTVEAEVCVEQERLLQVVKGMEIGIITRS